MNTHCTPSRFEFQAKGKRTITATFDGDPMTSDGGMVLLHEVDRIRDLTRRFAECFVDARDPDRIEHTVQELVRQRAYAWALGYEDLNDHEYLRQDGLLATVVGKAKPGDPPLAGKSTLNRLEWGLETSVEEHRYHRMAIDGEAVKDFFVEAFLESFEQAPQQIILDFDATDNPLHGFQEGRFFHGYYRHFCYLPLYVFGGTHVLVAWLRRSNIDASAGSVEVLERLVQAIRERFSEVQIVLRADSAFARDPLLSWCEENHVEYVVGLARNARLEALLEPAFDEAEELCAASGEPERVYAEFQYRTRDSWSRGRRVIGKAEITVRGPNPRFVLTSLLPEDADAQWVYEDLYCARGEAENRIKEQQLDLFSTRTSGRLMRVNQVRLWLAALAYTLLNDLRRLALVGSSMAKARCSSLRLRLLKIGARVKITARRVWVGFASSHPAESLFAHSYQRLRRLAST